MSQRTTQIILHSSGGVPCLRGDFHRNRQEPVLAVLGGRGKLGAKLVNHLVGRGQSVFSIDLNTDCTCSDMDSDDLVASTQEWHNQFTKLWSQLAEQAGVPQPLRALITASRHSAQKNSPGPGSILREFDQHLVAGLRAPLAAAVAGTPWMNSSLGGTIIFLSSVNAFTISHQPMGYHSAHSAIVQAARYLNIHLPRYLDVYCLLIGVLRLAPPYPDQQSRFNGVEAEEIFETVDFLLKGGNRSLAGEPIILGSSRVNLDATAVAQNRFGDLSYY